MEKFFRKAEVLIATDPKITVAASSEVTQEVALVETVFQNLSKFTKREVERAEEARKLFSVLGRPSVKGFISSVRNNHQERSNLCRRYFQSNLHLGK
jgi:hypothetical protein